MARRRHSPSIRLEKVQYFQSSQDFPQARRPQEPLLCLLLSINRDSLRKGRGDKAGTEARLPYAVASRHQKDRPKGDGPTVTMLLFR